MNSIALSGLGLILLYIVLILQKTPKKYKDYLIAVIFTLIGFELLFRYVNTSISNLYYTWLISLDLFYWVLFGPVMYLYVEFVIHDYRKFKLKDILHFIPLPFLLFPFVGFLINDSDNVGFFSFIKNNNLFYQIIIYIWDYITPAYFVFIVLKLFRHKKNAINYFSNLNKKDLGWLFYISSGYLLYLFIVISLNYITQILNIEIPYIDVETSIIPLIIYVFGLGIFGYKQEGIFIEEFSKSNQLGKKVTKNSTELKYFRSGLTREENKEIKQNLKTLMETEKPFLDSELTVNDLSKLINTTIHKLSQVINESFQKNFYEFINEYRIKEVERKLKDPANNHLKIISLGYDCGFNSKSAFYSAFKHYTGSTPSEYRENLQIQHERVLTD